MPKHLPRPAKDPPRDFLHPAVPRRRGDDDSDFRLPIILFFGSCAVVGITPFALLRFASGQWLIGLIDLLIVLAIGAMMAYAWLSGNTRRAGVLVALTNTIGCMAIIVLLGPYGLYWAYMVVLGNCMLLANRGLAIAYSLALLATAASQQALFASFAELMSFLTTSGMVAVCALIFVSRSELQQKRLAHLARRDPLTGVGNRRLMEEELDLLMQGALCPAENAALAVIDIDHFKAINDRFGHEAGDVVIRDLAEMVQSGVRKRDRLYRMGGEEFLLLLDGIDAAALEPMLDGLRARIHEQLDAPGGHITISIGAARHVPDEDWRRWLSRADAAMYDAKQGGRNRVRIFGEGAQSERPRPRADRRREVTDSP
jgi:diguanylate cyclase